MSTTTTPTGPPVAPSAGRPAKRVRGLVRVWGPWWAGMTYYLVFAVLETRIGYLQALATCVGVGIGIALLLAPLGRRAVRREEAALGGRGQRDMLETALTGARVPAAGDVPSWRHHLPVLRRRAEEAVLAIRWTWVPVLLSSVLVVLAGAAGHRSVAGSLSAVPVLTLVAWPFLAVHLRRRRDRLDALAERLGRG